MERPLALVVDRDPGIRAAVRDALAGRGRSALEAEDAEAVARILRERAIDLVVLDPDQLGVDIDGVLRTMSDRPQRPVVVVLTDEPSRDAETIRAGAFDVLRKPLTDSAVDACVERSLRQCDLLRECSRLRELQGREGRDAIVGTSAAITEVRERVRRLSASRVPVFVTGESGVGKELVARTLHDLSMIRAGEFVAVRCAVLGEETWDDRWFGEGATDGLLGRADRGTLFLEELPDLSPEMQARLLRTLGRDGKPERPELSRDFRVVASSRRDVERLVEDGGLTVPVRRALAVESLRVPPLRERPEDIAPLIHHFVTSICEINDLPEVHVEPEAVELLERHPWPANVRELRSAIEHALILSQDGTIGPEHLPGGVGGVDGGEERAAAAGRIGADRRFREAKRGVVESFERAYLGELMERHAGNVTAASQQAGMLRSALQRLLRKYGLKSADFRAPRRPSAVVARTRVE